MQVIISEHSRIDRRILIALSILIYSPSKIIFVIKIVFELTVTISIYLITVTAVELIWTQKLIANAVFHTK